MFTNEVPKKVKPHQTGKHRILIPVYFVRNQHYTPKP